jgi:hypothetical protein
MDTLLASIRQPAPAAATIVPLSRHFGLFSALSEQDFALCVSTGFPSSVTCSNSTAFSCNKSGTNLQRWLDPPSAGRRQKQQEAEYDRHCAGPFCGRASRLADQVCHRLTPLMPAF